MFSLPTLSTWASLPTEIARIGKRFAGGEKQLFLLLVQKTAAPRLLAPSRCCRIWSY